MRPKHFQMLYIIGVSLSLTFQFLVQLGLEQQKHAEMAQRQDKNDTK